MPQAFSFAVQRGNTEPIFFRLMSGADPFDLSALDDIRFRAEFEGQVLLRTKTGGGLIVDDPASGVVALTLSPAETRALPVGALTSYELEIWLNGAEQTVLQGAITAAGGINDDD